MSSSTERRLAHFALPTVSTAFPEPRQRGDTLDTAVVQGPVQVARYPGIATEPLGGQAYQFRVCRYSSTAVKRWEVDGGGAC